MVLFTTYRGVYNFVGPPTPSPESPSRPPLPVAPQPRNTWPMGPQPRELQPG